MVGNGCNSKREQLVTHLEQRNATGQTTTTGARTSRTGLISFNRREIHTSGHAHQPVPDVMLISHAGFDCVLQTTGKNRDPDFVVDKNPDPNLIVVNIHTPALFIRNPDPNVLVDKESRP